MAVNASEKLIKIVDNASSNKNMITVTLLPRNKTYCIKPSDVFTVSSMLKTLCGLFLPA